MIIKEGVNISGLDIKMRLVLTTADKIWKKYNQVLTITAGLEGTHSAGSLHYYGLALDLRSRYFTEQEKFKVVKELQLALGVGYQVIAHDTHIHVEYDPK